MLTIFTCPKPFKGHFGVIQQNAINSWGWLTPQPEILVFADEATVSDAVLPASARLVPGVAQNEYGTPLVSDIFARAQSSTTNRIMAFVNADIILTQSCVRAVAAAAQAFDKFLLVGRRTDVDLTRGLESLADIARLRGRGRLHSAGGIDWFVFPRGQYPPIPPFAIGRTGYDNWILWWTAQAGIPVIDATRAAVIYHQNHDYSHSASERVWHGSEAKVNHSLTGGWHRLETIADAAYQMAPNGAIEPRSAIALGRSKLRRTLSHWMRFSQPVRNRWRVARLAARFKSHES